MKASSPVFWMKLPAMAVGSVLLGISGVQAQNYPPAGAGLAPGAVQQPHYRQSGSAYVPPGTTRSAPQQQQPQRPVYQQPPPASPQGYQPGYGPPPPRNGNAYKPPSLQNPPATSNTKKPAVTAAATGKAKPHTLESKVARLEKNDAAQDRRINGLENGHVVARGSDNTPSEGNLYTVRSGDTLWRIADKHNTSINAIKSANHMNGETIAVGQALIIPGYRASGSSSNVASIPANVHIVRPGDTFSQISRTYGVSQDSLARANPSAYADRLLVGERIVIPGRSSGTSSTVATSGNTRAPSSTATATSRAHIVKKGESLGAIAKNYGIPTAALASANKIKNANLIAPGQRLIVPGGRSSSAPATPAPYYPPADNDTTPLPGAGLMASSPESAAYTPEPAPAPMAEPRSQPVAKATPPVSSNSRGIVAYRLERGDDINTVASLFNTTPEKIRDLNKLEAGSKLKEGDEVVVPSLGAVSLN